MEVTMLYFDTVSKLIEEHGYTWKEVSIIKDHKDRVRFSYSPPIEGEPDSYTVSFKEAFRLTHFGRSFINTGDMERNLIKSFLEALEEVKKRQKLYNMSCDFYIQNVTKDCEDDEVNEEYTVYDAIYDAAANMRIEFPEGDEYENLVHDIRVNLNINL